MNQKKLRYVLIAGVVLVWGLIVYRVVEGLGEDDDTPILRGAIVKAEVMSNEPDSFHLIADYPDPFVPASGDEDTGVAGSSVLPGAATAAPVPAYTPPVEAYKEGTIKYLGMIANPSTKMKVAVIQVNGKEMMVKEGDKVEEFMMRKIEKDRLVVAWKGKTVTVSR